MSDLTFEGMAIADGVVETIVSMAVQDVEGVANISGMTASGILNFKNKPGAKGVEAAANEDGTLAVSVRIGVDYGYPLPAVAEAIRQAVADAVAVQIGLQVSNVDVYIDSIQF